MPFAALSDSKFIPIFEHDFINFLNWEVYLEGKTSLFLIFIKHFTMYENRFPLKTFPSVNENKFISKYISYRMQLKL